MTWLESVRGLEKFPRYFTSVKVAASSSNLCEPKARKRGRGRLRVVGDTIPLFITTNVVQLHSAGSNVARAPAPGSPCSRSAVEILSLKPLLGRVARDWCWLAKKQIRIAPQPHVF